MISRRSPRNFRNRTRRRGASFPAALLGAALLLGGTLSAFAETASTSGGGKVNINQATAAQIAYLPRIGAKVALRVVEHRNSHGPFARPEDLMEVKGIGEKLFLTLKPYVAVSGPTTLAAKVRSGPSRKREAPGPAPKPSQKSAPAAVPAGKGR